MAKDVITRFRLETTQFDSKIKSAAKGLSEYTKSASNAGKEFQKFTKDNVAAAQALGKMATSSQDAKGKVNELVGAFNEAAKAYNALTKEQQQSDFGKAMAASLTQLQQRIRETKAEMQSMGNVSKSMGGGFLSGIGSKMEGALAVFGGNIMTKAAGAVASLGSEMADMVKQGVELAKQGEGIRIAFERLGRGDILQGLREATHGTVTDLELMKAAVKFNDFKLPLDELGTMLAFAQQKAKDTGQSVDYMVDSIVTGLGRKSLMILDNLGLSAAEIKEKMKETGDMTKAVGAIIREQMEKAGDYVETAADRAQQATVSLQNKMEELGRKFAPLEEASNNFWTSMKIGILDVVGGPLANLLNKLTVAGRLMNAYQNMGGSGKVGRMTNTLAGTSQQNRQSLYNQQVQQFWKYINPREQQIKDIRAWQRGERGEALQGRVGAIRDKYGSLDATKIQAEVDAAKKMLTDYQQAAKTILKPVKAEINTSDAVKSIDELKVRLIELQAQRKKVKAGTDEAKRLDAEIRNVKADIKLQDPNAFKKTSTTHHTTPQEKAATLVENAERTYAETLQKASIRLEVGLDSEVQAKKKELSAQERLFDAYNDAYATFKDPKYKEAASSAADKIKALAGEVKSMEDAVKAAKVKWVKGASGFNSVSMGEWMKGRQGDLSKAEYGSAEHKSIMANIADMNAIKTILEQSMAAGIDAAQFNLEPLWEKVFDGENIDDKVWQGMVDTINEKLKELNIEPIKIDFNTGGIKKVNDETKKLVKAANTTANVVGSIGDAFNAIEDPAAKVAGTVAQAIASVALGYAQATKQASSMGPWAWIAFAASGLAQMLTMISTIHSATGYAEGGIVKGNHYSGDMLDGGSFGINAGELVLNRAQQGSLASQLEGSAGGFRNGQIVGRIEGEKIVLVANRYFRRTGQGEIVTWK